MRSLEVSAVAPRKTNNRCPTHHPDQDNGLFYLLRNLEAKITGTALSEKVKCSQIKLHSMHLIQENVNVCEPPPCWRACGRRCFFFASCCSVSVLFDVEELDVEDATDVTPHHSD